MDHGNAPAPNPRDEIASLTGLCTSLEKENRLLRTALLPALAAAASEALRRARVEGHPTANAWIADSVRAVLATLDASEEVIPWEIYRFAILMHRRLQQAGDLTALHLAPGSDPLYLSIRLERQAQVVRRVVRWGGNETAAGWLAELGLTAMSIAREAKVLG